MEHNEIYKQMTYSLINNIINSNKHKRNNYAKI